MLKHRDELARQHVLTEEVGGVGDFPPLVGDRAFVDHDSDVVHEAVQWPVRGDVVVGEPHDGFHRCKVGAMGNDLSLGFVDEYVELVCASADSVDSRSVGGEPYGNCTAYAPGRSGDHDVLPSDFRELLVQGQAARREPDLRVASKGGVECRIQKSHIDHCTGSPDFADKSSKLCGVTVVSTKQSQPHERSV